MLREFFNFEKQAKLSFLKQIEENDNLQIIRLKGPVDRDSLPELERLNKKAAGKAGFLKKNILIDFKDVTHVDSATIAVLIQILSRLKHENHKMGLINVTPELRDMLGISRVSDLFCVYDSEEKALKESNKTFGTCNI